MDNYETTPQQSESLSFTEIISVELIKQCAKLCTLKSNIAPKDCALLAIFGEALSIGDDRLAIRLGFPSLIKTIKTEFYKQYAARHFDRYIISMASCDVNHVHASSCISLFDPRVAELENHIKGRFDEVRAHVIPIQTQMSDVYRFPVTEEGMLRASDNDIIECGGQRVTLRSYKKTLSKAQSNVDQQAKELNVEPRVVIGIENGDWRRPIFQTIDPPVDEAPRMNGNILSKLVVVAEETSAIPQALKDAWKNAVPLEPTQQDMDLIKMNGFACECEYAEWSEEAAWYGTMERKMTKEQKARAEAQHLKAKTYWDTVYYEHKHRERRKTQTIERKNAEYRKFIQSGKSVHMNGFTDRLREAKETYQRGQDLMNKVDTVLRTAETWQAWMKDTCGKMIPHLVATITRWLVQPPTFMALCLDLFILIERIAPERVKQGFFWFISSASKLKDDAIVYRQQRAAIRTSAASRPKMNGKGDDEALEKASWITNLAELLTGLRLKDRVKNTCRLAMTFGKIVRDVNTYRKAIKELVSPVIDFLSGYIRISILDKLFKKVMTKEDLVQFVTDVELLKGYGDVEIASADFPEEVNRLWNIAVKVRRILVTQKLDPHVKSELSQACAALSKFRDRHYVALQNSWGAVRKTPFVIALVGASGCGKSDVAPMLAKDMCHPGNCNMDVTTENLTDLIYFYSGLKHWDGYRGQPVCFWDDFGQKKEDANTTAEDSNYLWFIKLISGVQVPLPMAHLDQKGMYFNSPLTILTQNEIYPVASSVTCPEAVQKRVNIRAYVTTDLSEPLYPMEEIEYDNGYIERKNMYMQFHILPSVRKINGVVVGTQNLDALPKHGDALGLSYTEFLELCVNEFNTWQETSSVARMSASTPTCRIFNTGVAPVNRGTRPDRFNPKMNGWTDWIFGKDPNPIVIPLGRELKTYVNGSVDARMEGDEETRDYRLGVNTDLADVLSASNETDFFSKMANITGFDSIKGVMADHYKMSVSALETFAREHPVLTVMAMAVWLLGVFGALYLIWRKEDSDKEPELIAKEAIDQFCDTTDLIIRDDMRLMLYDISNQLEKERITANMAANGYDAKILKSKAGRVGSPRFVQKMSEKIKMNGGLENNAAVEHIVYGNMRVISYHNSNGAMQAIGLVGRYMVCNAHFFKMAEHYQKIQNGVCEFKVSFNGVDQWLGYLDMSQVRIYDDMDLAIFQLPRNCPQFKDIRKHFISENDFGQTNNVPVRMLTTFKRCHSSRTMAKLNTQELTYEFDGDKSITTTVAHSYMMELSDFSYGDCGGPMIVEHMNKIAAIHAASSPRYAYSVPVFRELFKNLSADYAEEAPITKMNLFVQKQGDVEPVGVIPTEWRTFVQDKTNIVPSPIHGQVAPVTKQPSVKTLKDVRVSEEAKAGEEPLIKSFKQMYNPAVDIKPHILRRAHLAIAAVLSFIKPTLQLRRRLLSEDEVLNGADGVYPALNVHTSAGMPQRTYAPGSPGKTAFFRRDINGKLAWADSKQAARFKADYETYEAQLRTGVIPFVFVCETLKDETLKLQKIKDAKTRTFEVFPGPLAMLYRKYFGAFNAALQADCVQSPVSVGINAHSVDWQFLYNRLNRFGGKVIAGDYVAWDKRLCGQVIMESIDSVNEWYLQVLEECTDDLEQLRQEIEDDNEVRILLGQILCNTYIVVMDILYRTSQGMPSGVPVTSPLNSIANWHYLLSAMFEILESKGVLRDMLPHEVNDHVEFALYGDDHIIAMDAMLREHITFQDVEKHFRSRLVGYTDANKNAVSEFDFEELTDVTFLKRKFLPENGRVYAPLDKSSVEDQLNWINHTDSMNSFDIFAQCLRGFQIEAHLHGKSYFENITAKVRQALLACESPQKELALKTLGNASYDEFWRCYNSAYSSL